MSKASRRSRRQRISNEESRSPRAALPARMHPLAGSAVIVVAVFAAIVLVAVIFGVVGPGSAAVVAWSRLGTDDVHSLAFVGDDPNRLLFGHHGGILSSNDGGRTWNSLATGSDAMSLGAATDGSIVVAGHNVLALSPDDGRTWQDIAADLPGLDIHGFARDPSNPARMWAYLATGGFWESLDAGRTWEQVHQDNILFPIGVAAASGTRLFGLTASGLASSNDGGRNWQSVATPELYPIASLAATSDGSVLVAGGPDGLARSDDGGASWSTLSLDAEPAAIAVTAGGRTIAVVTRNTDFLRSDDGGRTWPGP